MQRRLQFNILMQFLTGFSIANGFQYNLIGNFFSGSPPWANAFIIVFIILLVASLLGPPIYIIMRNPGTIQEVFDCSAKLFIQWA